MTRFRKYLIAAASLALVEAPVAASADSLEDALALAYRTNPTIRAQRAQLRATEELKWQAWAGALPQINAQGTYSRVNGSQTRSDTPIAPGVTIPGETEDVDLETLQGTIVGEQVLFNGFRHFNAIRQANARVRAGGAQLASVEQDVLRRVALAYFDVLRDTTNYESSVNNVDVLMRQKEEAQLRFDVGEVTRTDVAQADARLALARANLTTSQAQLAISRAVYTELVGQAPGSLEPPSDLPEMPATLETALNLSQIYSPVVVGAREQEEAARRGVALAKGTFAPTVSANASYQYAEDPSTFITQTDNYSYGLRASVPLFTGGLNLSRTREALALRDSAIARVHEAERQAARATSASWEQLIAAQMTIRSTRVQVEANELALTGVRREAQLGTRTTLDVLDAEQEYLNALVNLANAERNERAAAFSLLAAIGLLNPDAIGVDPERLLPEEDGVEFVVD